MRTRTLSKHRWEQFLLGLLLETRCEESQAQTIIVQDIMLPLFDKVNEMLQYLRDKLKQVNNGPWIQLIRRWEQIRARVQQALTSIKQDLADQIGEGSEYQ